MDCTLETLKHIKSVSKNINEFAIELLKRANTHDDSKLCSPEKEGFDEVTEKLSKLEYGSEEYNENLKDLQPVLEHHYHCNSHHPQFYLNGVDGMNLFDIVEMYCDWLAAVQRTKDGSFEKSLEINEKRFNINPQLIHIFKNTFNNEKH